MIAEIEEAAVKVGIRAIVTDSERSIGVQLKGLTRDEDLPILLISWDITTTVEFDSNGFLKNPFAKVVYLLLKKPEILSKDDYRDCSEEMQEKFFEFLQELYPLLTKYKTSADDRNIKGIECKLVPVKKPSHHSGCTGKFSMLTSKTSRCS